MTTIWHRIRLGAVLGLAAFALGCASTPQPEPAAPADGVVMHPEFHGAHISPDRLRDRLPSEN